ncbi:hypothetical protein M3090_06405 [Bacteroides sp. ET71]|nr:hypothetical protein [Bacteroides sp. ET71]MCL1616024.1 hypothetical protein [Bacteroides sp. ET71]
MKEKRLFQSIVAVTNNSRAYTEQQPRLLRTVAMPVTDTRPQDRQTSE